MGVAVGNLDAIVLFRDGMVTGWNVGVSPALTNIVAVSDCLASRSNGTVLGLDGQASATIINNVSAISGRLGFGLVVTTKPPQPVLEDASSGSNLLRSAPVSVPGFALESSAGLSLPYTQVPGYTNAAATNFSLTVPISSPQ